MSGVVLRCPNCGTTRAAPGECEACHEAQVRPYCTNHTPGAWLDAGVCPQCGARPGDPARTPKAPAPAAPRRMPAPAPPPASAAPPRAAPRSSRSSRSPAVPGPARHAPGERPGEGGGPEGGRERWPPARPEEIDLRDGSDGRDGRDRRVTSWHELLRAAARTRRMPPEAVPGFEAAPAGRGLGGCLWRFVLIVVFLFLALVSGLFLFGGSLLQMLLR